MYTSPTSEPVDSLDWLETIAHMADNYLLARPASAWAQELLFDPDRGALRAAAKVLGEAGMADLADSVRAITSDSAWDRAADTVVEISAIVCDAHESSDGGHPMIGAVRDVLAPAFSALLEFYDAQGRVTLPQAGGISRLVILAGTQAGLATVDDMGLWAHDGCIRAMENAR